MCRVLTLIEDGRMGGIHYRVARVNAIFAQTDIHGMVVFPNKDSDKFQSLLRESEIEYYPLKLARNGMSVGLRINYVVNFPGDIWRIVHLIKNTKADIIHCNGVWQVKGIVAARLAGVKSIWHLNDTSSAKIFRIVFKRLLWHWPAALIVASERTKAYYLSQDMESVSRIKMIPAPVDTIKFCRSWVAESHDDNSVLHIGTVANINQNKGIHVFLKMAEILNSRLGKERLQFSVIGPVLPTQIEYNKRLLDFIEVKGLDNVEMRGRVEDIPAALNEFDIYVCSSFNESSPTSIWEAMAMSLPVVSTEVGDVKQIIDQYACGVIVDPGNAEQLASAIEGLSSSGDKREMMGQRARQAACENFDLQIVAKQHSELYLEICTAK